MHYILQVIGLCGYKLNGENDISCGMIDAIVDKKKLLYTKWIKGIEDNIK
jgi:hypothetical protein